MEKSKGFCYLDSDNYFLFYKVLYRDPKKGEIIPDDNAYEIPQPDMNHIVNGIKAKWNFKKKAWVYETKPEENILLNLDPMYYFRIARKRRLDYVNEYIMNQVQKGIFTIDPKLTEYKNKVFNLPQLIEDGEINAPLITDDISKYKTTKNPEDMIIFNDWPEYNFKG